MDATRFLKVDSTKRRVYGIVLEANVPDLQGDIVRDDQLEEAAVSAVKKNIPAGYEHERMGVGRLIASFPLTREIQKGLGFALPNGRSAWVVGYEITDPSVWASVVNGELAGFSLGGKGKRNPA